MGNANRANVINTMRSLKGKLSYSNKYTKPTYKTLVARGSGDCSDLTHACFERYGYTLGAYANDQAKDGKEVYTWSGKSGHAVAAFNKIFSKVRQADIICMDLVGNGRYTHVETIVADKSGNSIGHGSGIGPKEQNLGLRWLLGSATKFTIRRIIPDIPSHKVYSGSSIVLYLKSIGVNSSFANRRKLAKKHGIKSYVGTAKQNTKLLTKMRGF